MEYKKVEKCTRREETRQTNNVLKEKSGKCNITKAIDSNILSILERSNTSTIDSRQEFIVEKEELNLNSSKKISKISYSSEIIRETNFEYEEEWDIGGIPELLNELDADIEQSIKNIQTSKLDGRKNVINNKQDILKSLKSKISENEKVSSNFHSHENTASLKLSKNKIAFEKNISASTFTGFSKGGYLISNSTNSISLNLTSCNESIGQHLKPTKNSVEQSCAISMTSQAGNNGNCSSNISGTGINITCVQSISGSSSSNKPNNKMSIDHQATLDKGLKMKIKRTKPGSKSSEAKHEIVKATEQQNGITGSACLTNQEDITCLLSNSSNSQNSNLALGISNSLGNSNIIGNKKNLGSSNNQNNISSTSATVSLNNAGCVGNNISGTLTQGTKRGSSGHRRDKTKDKLSHSNRGGTEKNFTTTSDKESVERPLCHCSTIEGDVSSCSNNSCLRKTENNTVPQNLPPKNTGGNISVVPPGVFTPSSDTSASAVVSNLLAVTCAISTPVSTQTISSGVNANTPGPPSKDISSNSGANVKISSHIAAQLAAAAASNSSINGSSISAPSFPNSDLKSPPSNVQSNTAKQLSPSQISSAIVNHAISAPLSNQKSLSVSSTVGTEKPTFSILKNENSESPPPKRLKHTDNNATATSINKEMVDICIGTSVGTITEPDCLGPCEPGTSVTLEGIVWHETEGGVLVVNVTWRGKTYVGTLLDCTRHDWAPPRFCDSPTEDLDARTPKGRGKRSRATITPDLSNFTETRSSIYFSHSHVHSKLRNGSTKGGRGSSRTTSLPPVEKTGSGSSLSSGNSASTPSTSPTAFLTPRAEKRKSKDESPPPVHTDIETGNAFTLAGSCNTISSNTVDSLINQPQSLINPVTGLNVQICTKKSKTPSPCAVSPVLLECPENDCSKKYKHVNGLRYHQSHAHGNSSLLDEYSMAEIDDQITSQPSPLSPTPCLTPIPSDLTSNNEGASSSQPETGQISHDCKKKINEDVISQQFENSEKNFTSETVSSLSSEGVLTSTASSSSTPPAPSASETISSRIAQHEQEKQFPDLVENNKIDIFSLESNNPELLESSTEKSGILPFAPEECKNNSGSSILPTKSTNAVLVQSESLESDSSKKGASGLQDSNNTIFCADGFEKSTNLNQNQHNIPTNKTSPENSVVAKSKKERKSPSINDYESVGLNTCNLPPREDVQSPAYSDISDDSTPVNESDPTHKVDISKNSNAIKKPEDIALSSSTTCPSNHTKMSSTLSSYGVYQFYQQQQYIVQPAAEQQQPTKNTLNSNIVPTIVTPSLTQQQTVSEFSSKKEPPLDLITTKANTNQAHSNQLCLEMNKDSTRSICGTDVQGNSELPAGPGGLNSTTPPKHVSHFYAFNYMPSNYSFNVDHNFPSSAPITTSEDTVKQNRFSGLASPNDQSALQHNLVLYKEECPKEEIGAADTAKSANLQISKQLLKSTAIAKSDCIKQESSLTQIPHHVQKDHQGMGVYTNMYQRVPLSLPSQHHSREEELRRYYVFSDQQRRQNSSSHNAINQQMQNSSGSQQCKEDSGSAQQHAMHSQPQVKVKGNIPLNINKPANSANTSKESPKNKQEDELKVIKQEGQKPTMETQGPPPPPTSQYFLHPPYITSTPFGFDPSHPMYRNVLMPASSPYNTPPYHLPIPRYHAPEDLSRNTGTKALDALHHAASQYYTTHKIHELSERALKSPNNTNSNNISGTIKIGGSSPNIGSTQHSNIGSNIIGHHAVQNQSSSCTQLPHNLPQQSVGITNKQDIAGQKTHGSSHGVATTTNEPQKAQISVNSSSSSSIANSSSNNINSGSTSDSRSPPPQRHVHTHHHTHVGLGYPMYPAPYGAAVLASQQAAAVAVINPFPPGPNK